MNIMPKNSLYFVLFSLLIYSCNRLTNEKLLKLELVFPKEHFQFNEQINCSFNLINKSKDSIGIYYPMNLGFADDSLVSLKLIIKKNKILVETKKNIHYQFIKNSTPVFLQAKEFTKNSFPISDFYPLPSSGTYWVQGIYSDSVKLNNTSKKLVTIASKWHKIIVSK